MCDCRVLLTMLNSCRPMLSETPAPSLKQVSKTSLMAGAGRRRTCRFDTGLSLFAAGFCLGSIEVLSSQDLNGRFANYIEKNRFLEAQLKSVEQRLKDLQSKWGT